jgi:hypothetical protein
MNKFKPFKNVQKLISYKRLFYLVNKRCLNNDSENLITSKSDEQSAKKHFSLEKPEAPLTCCGSGCQNCVYLKYADDLMSYYQKKYSDNKQGLSEAIKEIDKLTDENLKSYLLMEIQIKYR